MLYQVTTFKADTLKQSVSEPNPPLTPRTFQFELQVPQGGKPAGLDFRGLAAFLSFIQDHQTVVDKLWIVFQTSDQIGMISQENATGLAFPALVSKNPL